MREFVSPNDHILLPGVGCDGVLRDLYDAGYTQLDAFDYAAQSIEYCRNNMLQHRKVHLQVADARNLSWCYSSHVFDAVLDKGTLDAVFLAGNTAKERADSLQHALLELQRVLRPGDVFWSLSAICVDALMLSQDKRRWLHWQVLADGTLYSTRDGCTSNNIDGTLMVWRKPFKCMGSISTRVGKVQHGIGDGNNIVPF